MKINHPSLLAIKIICSVILFSGVFPLYVGAELVSTRLETSQKGHAWLFGSPVDASCWVAAPAHVFRGPDNRLYKAILQLGDGKETQLSKEPVQPDPNIDLAFAPVTMARSCLDRLGQSDLSRLINTADDVKLSTLTASIHNGIKVRVRNLSDSGVEIIVEPVNSENKLRQGFSGGLISAPRASSLDGSDIPLGMLLRVCDRTSGEKADDLFATDTSQTGCNGEQHYGIALRFDKIREMFLNFAEVENKTNRSAVLNAAGNKVSLLSTTGETMDATQGPDNVFNSQNNGGCWRVRSDEKGRVKVEIRIDGAPPNHLEVFACPGAPEVDIPQGVGLSFVAARQSPNTSSIRYCESHKNLDFIINCQFSPRSGEGTYLLEFKAVAKNANISIGKILMD